MSKVFTQKETAGAFIVSEAAGGSTGESRSRDNIVLSIDAVNGVLPVGTLLAAGATAGEFVIAAAGADVVGILFDEADVSEVAVDAVGIVRDAEVNAEELSYGALDAAGILDARAALSAVGIIVRDVSPTLVDSADPIPYTNDPEVV